MSRIMEEMLEEQNREIKISICNNLLVNGVSPEDAAKYLGLSIEQVTEIERDAKEIIPLPDFEPRTKKYWWDDEPCLLKGHYHFCYDTYGHHHFDLIEVDVAYSHWTDESKNKSFGSAKFIFYDSSPETSLGNITLLKATNINDAKKEFEDFYMKKLDEKISKLEKELKETIDDKSRFSEFIKE